MDMKRAYPVLLPLVFALAMLATACGAESSDSIPTTAGAVEDSVSEPAEPTDSEPADSQGEPAQPADEDPLAQALEDAGIDTSAPELTDDGWLRVPQRNDLTNTQTHDIIKLVVIDETHIGVRFEAIGEGCSGAEAFADESDTDVTIELFVGLPPEAISTTCMMVQVQKEIVVELAAPLGNRSLTRVSAAITDDAAITV